MQLNDPLSPGSRHMDRDVLLIQVRKVLGQDLKIWGGWMLPVGAAEELPGEPTSANHPRGIQGHISRTRFHGRS